MIVHDEKNPTALRLREVLDRHLPEGLDGDELVVVIGGDGFMLQTVAAHGFGRTYLGINAGHLGFLLNDVADWAAAVDQLRRRAFRAFAFPLLEATVHRRDGTKRVEHAMNDVYLERMSAQTARLVLTIDGHCVVEPLVADGLLFATALGSTAYAFSAGGPACHPALRLMNVAAICPHHPRLSPFVLPATARATVEVRNAEYRPVRAVADGRQVDDVLSVEVAVSPWEVRLAYLEGHDFTTTMIRKILHP